MVHSKSVQSSLQKKKKTMQRNLRTNQGTITQFINLLHIL